MSYSFMGFCKEASGKDMQRESKKIGADQATTRRLDKRRRSIDEIDATLLDLINKRLSQAKEIGKIKEDHRAPIRDSVRESEILERLMALNEGCLLSKTSLLQIFSDIVAASRDIQKPSVSNTRGKEVPSVYVVMGNPIAHSLSPVMHNMAFRATQSNAVYIAVEVKDISSAITGFRNLHFKGASITIPYKVSVMEYLDVIDSTALSIKAVNTIIKDNGRLVGFNTDCDGAVRALSEKTSISGKKIAIIGAGGAARAIAYGITSEKGSVTILNRSRDKGEQLARDLELNFRPLSECRHVKCDIVINTTPVGMTPYVDEMPLPADFLENDMVVMDVVYSPLKTKLLKTAENIGCVTVDGISMFVYQGAKQFELWTGLDAPLEIMKMAVTAALEQKSSKARHA